MKPPPVALKRHPTQLQTVAEDARPANRPMAWRGMTTEDKRRRRLQEKAAEKRAANRAWLLQCSRCRAIATGRVTRSGVLVSHGFKVEYGRHTVSSAGRCGGLVRAFDFTDNNDAA